MKERKWEKVSVPVITSDFFNFEEAGDMLEGKLIRYRNINTKFGNADVADIEDEEGKDWTVIITSGMRELGRCRIGDFVQILYEGYVKNPKSGRIYKSFTISIDREHVNEEELPF